jgi:hypothetical protein
MEACISSKVTVPSWSASIALNAERLPLVDKIALCAAGLESQSVFNAPAHPYAGIMDEARIILTENLDEELRLAQRNDGYQRAHDLIKAHAAKVDQLAKNCWLEDH